METEENFQVLDVWDCSLARIQGFCGVHNAKRTNSLAAIWQPYLFNYDDVCVYA